MPEQNLGNNVNSSINEQHHEETLDNSALFITEWKLKADETLEFPIQGREGTIVVEWGDGSSDTISSGDDAYISHKYTDHGVYTVKVDGTITRWSCRLDSADDDRIRATPSRPSGRVSGRPKPSNCPPPQRGGEFRARGASSPISPRALLAFVKLNYRSRQMYEL